MPKVWALQHAACETLGTIADPLAAAGIEPRYVRSFAGERVPGEMGDAIGLVVMGGPMGVYEQSRYPFLKEEMRLIERALEEGYPILGACLGSQLLATTLGAPVRKGREKEIGWHPVTLTGEAAHDPLWEGIPHSFVPFHWHGDVFELPHGALSLASSALTEHQAFRYGESAYGLLFHMEVTEEIIRGMVETFADELQGAGVEGAPLLRGIPRHLPALHDIGGAVLRRWVALLHKAPH